MGLINRGVASYHNNGLQRGVASPHTIPTDFNPLIKNRSIPSYHNNGFQSVDTGIIPNG